MMFSLICPCNNRILFDECVGASLAMQSFQDCELILVDTLAEAYSSAAAALNDGASRAHGDYLIFLHQDVCFDDVNFLEKLSTYVVKYDFAVAGVAGAIQGKSRYRTKTYTNIVHGMTRRQPGTSKNISGETPMPCDTLDECLFIIPAKLFRTRTMREYIPTWHLYAVEYCLWARAHDAGQVLIFPLKLWHRSPGSSYNMNYFDAISAIRQEYRRQFDVIYTTMGAWPTGYIPFHLKKWYRIIKYKFNAHRRTKLKQAGS